MSQRRYQTPAGVVFETEVVGHRSASQLVLCSLDLDFQV